MRLLPERKWQIATAASAAAAAISAAVAFISAAGGDTVNTVFSGICLILFAACAIQAHNAGSKHRELNDIQEEVSCLRLKRPGIEKGHEEEMVPKGKMPKG